MTRRHPFGREVPHTGGLFSGSHATGPARLLPVPIERRHRGCGGIVMGGARFCNLCRRQELVDEEIVG